MQVLDVQTWNEVIDVVRLTQWMDERRLGSGPITHMLPLAGGTQNILVRFCRNERAFVLRRPPKHLRVNSNSTMSREARVLGALASSNVPHPRLIAECRDPAVLGAAFYLMQPVLGFNATVEMPEFHRGDSDVRRRMGFSLVDSIAALGKVDYLARELHDFGKIDGFLERQVGRWRDQLQSYAQFPAWDGARDLRGVDDICAWLNAKMPARLTPGIIHGDYHFANVLFHHDSPFVAAIVDWELSTIGDPLLDLGGLLATWPQPEIDNKPPIVQPWSDFPSAAQLVNRYAAQVDRDMTPIRWFAVLACFKLGVLLEGTYARSKDGKALPETGRRLHSNAINLFNRAQRFICNSQGTWI